MKRLTDASLLLGIALAALTIACSSGGGSSAPPAAPANVAGTWTISEDITGNCPGLPDTDQYSVSVTQSGASITVDAPNGQFHGQVSGNVLGWTGSYPEDGGTTTITSMSLTINGNSLSGTAYWSWSDGSDSCSGQTAVTGNRTSADASAAAGRGYFAMLGGAWEWSTEVIHSDGDCERRVGDVGTLDVALDAVAGVPLVFGLGEEPVPVTVDGASSQLVFVVKSVLPTGAQLREDYSMVVSTASDPMTVSGICAWQIRRGDEVVAEGTSLVEGERLGARSPRSQIAR